jgi:hypothetical protein
MRTSWTDEKILEQLKELTKNTEIMPTSNYLKEIGRNDIMCAISKRKGFRYYAEKLNLKTKKTDSSFGYEGEIKAIEMIESKGFETEKMSSGFPYDILVNNLCRIDVKTAKFAEYGISKGWFYRIGKEPSCDLIMLIRIDIGDCLLIPWMHCSSTNITISRSMRKHKIWHNRYDLITKTIDSNSILLESINNNLQ